MKHFYFLLLCVSFSLLLSTSCQTIPDKSTNSIYNPLFTQQSFPDCSGLFGDDYLSCYAKILPDNTHWHEANSPSEIKRIIQTKRKVVVLFGATWCHTCPFAEKFWRQHSVSGYYPVHFTAKGEELREFLPLFRHLRLGNSLPMIVFFEQGKEPVGFANISDATTKALRWLYEK